MYPLRIKRMDHVGRPHSIAVGKTAAALRNVFGGGYAVEQQMPMQMGDDLEPSPNV